MIVCGNRYSWSACTRRIRLFSRAILQEIHRLRLQQQQQTISPSQCSLEHSSYQLVSSSDSHLAPRSCSMQAVPCLRYSLVDELCHLRRRRDELECRMMALQSSRLELVSQLEELMNVLKVSCNKYQPQALFSVDKPTIATESSVGSLCFLRRIRAFYSFGSHVNVILLNISTLFVLNVRFSEFGDVSEYVNCFRRAEAKPYELLRRSPGT